MLCYHSIPKIQGKIRIRLCSSVGTELGKETAKHLKRMKIGEKILVRDFELTKAW